ncbi:hypothetical protein [Phaffia rhodozyma]|uniref:Uncharacterized protein n=1 Tax=Phaffia rhodozyma TaxID=264483 RepID=A0A0F7SMF8_PHARH|nr:hypothetical protein [Phaffia rhodozyma]
MSAGRHAAGPLNPSTPIRKPTRPSSNLDTTTASSSSLTGSRTGQSSDDTPSKKAPSRGTVRLKRQPGAKGVVQYQSLEQLLAQAGYTETRVITPESIRIKERAAWIRAQEEEEQQEATHARETKEVSEIERFLFEDHFSSSTTDSTSQLDSNSDTDTDTVESIPKSEPGSGSTSLGRNVDEQSERETGKAKKPWSAFRPVVDNRQHSRQHRHQQLHHRLSKEWDSSSNAIVYHYPADAFSLVDHPTTGRMPRAVPSFQDIQNGHNNNINNCHSEEECGSLSSSLSTFSAADTIILSPPDLNVQAFENQSASEDDADDDQSYATWSIPFNESVEDLRMSQASSRPIRPFNRSIHHGQTPLPLPNAGPAQQALEFSESDVREDKSLFASSEAARSLRRISSLAQLSSPNSSASTSVKPKFFNAFTFFSSSSFSPASDEAILKRPALSTQPKLPDQAHDTLLKRTLRHTASTPVLARRTGSSNSSSEAVPPLPTGWLETIKNTLQSTISSTPSSIIPSTSTLMPKDAPPILRQSSSPAVLSFPLSSSSASCSENVANEKPVSVHLRSAPLIPKLTPSTVVCGSEEGEDLPPFSSLSFFNQSSGSKSGSTSTSSPVTPHGSVSETIPSPVLTPKISFGEGEGWSRTTCPGWVWTEGTDDREEDGWYATPMCSFEDSPLDNSSPPRFRAATVSSSSSSFTTSPASTASATSAATGGSRFGILRAQRSIKSLRETLAADSTAQAVALAKAKAQAEIKAAAAAAVAAATAANHAFRFKTPNRRQNKASSPLSIKHRSGPVPIFCISSPDTLELGLPPRELDVEEEERRASALVALALSSSRKEAEDEGWGGGRRKAVRKERKVRREVGRKK